MKIFPFKMGRGMFSRMPLKERIAQAVFRLETQLSRLEQTASRLHQRDREMFERCIGAKAQGDIAHAIIYANECAEIRKMAKIVYSSQLALERAVLRLKTIEEIGDVLVHLGPVLSIMKETKGKLTGVIPEVSRELEEISEFLNGTLDEVGLTPDVQPSVEASSQEAKRILDEAAAIAEEKVKEIYPDLPVPPTEEAAKMEAEALPEGEAEAETQEIPPIKLQPTPEEVKERLYEYLKTHGGELALAKCCKELNVSRDLLNQALELLEQEGRIKLLK
ncbi:MAG: Snf7 family protein [Candidatus Hecatellaceae archaeon]